MPAPSRRHVLQLDIQALQCEHILPEARGGSWTWMNLVTACGACNSRKACRTPEEADMRLQDMSYVPSRLEDFLLAGRHIRGDVHEWLAYPQQSPSVSLDTRILLFPDNQPGFHSARGQPRPSPR
jgi:HNH endonuclease